MFSWCCFILILIILITDSYSNVTLSDMQALESLFDATNGENWLWRLDPHNEATSFFGRKWNFSIDSDGNYSHDPCSEKWQGICCTQNLSQKIHNLTELCSHVFNSRAAINNSLSSLIAAQAHYFGSCSIVGIVLNAYGLNGQLPHTFFNLTSLVFISMSFNRQLGGILPSAVGQLTRLEYLDMQINNFIGTIPQQLDGLTLLTLLGLDHNTLDGTIPLQLGDLTLLSVFSLDHNMLTGTIPHELGKLTLLSELYLDHNILEGTIPQQFGALVNLTVLYLDHNFLEGAIPNELQGLTLVTGLCLSSNMLEGVIPSVIKGLSSIVSLYVNNNNFEGHVPSCLGLLTSLQVFAGGCNSFSGTLPQLSRLTNLTTLLLQNNFLTGWPLHALSVTQSKLSTVDLSDNSFSGSFPSAMFEFASMQSVSLVSNCFVGSISSDLCLGSNLQVLALDGLTSGRQCRKRLFGALSAVYVVDSYMLGSVPACLFTMSSLAVLQLSGNGLSGELPSEADFRISSSLRNLSLSHNRLAGTIPQSFQIHDFSLLDLSYNKFSGTVDQLKDFFVSSRNTSGGLHDFFTHKQLTLQVNRLSGTLPSSFVTVNNIQVVLGNLFTCDQQHQLPVNDPGTQLVQCGSQELNIALILWLVLMFASAVGMFYYNFRFKHLLLLTRNASVTNSEIYVSILVGTGLVLAYWMFGELVIKNVLKQQYGTHSFQYAYTPSLAFMTSDTPAVWTLISAMTWMILVYVMMTRYHSKSNGGSEEQLLRWRWRVVAAVIVVTLVDWLAMAAANFGYIYTVLYSKPSTSYLGQIALTIFKLTVNGWVLPKLSSDTINQSVLTGLTLCNNLLIPIFTIMCTEPNCFSELFMLTPSVSSLFIYVQPCKFLFSSGACLGYPAEVQTSYQPPFIYTYQCSSNMLTTYLPVFVMMYTYIGLIQPLITACLTCANAYKSKWSIKITSFVGCDIMLPDGQGKKIKLYNGSQLSVMLVCHAVTLLTFGTAYPLLAVLICTAVCVEAVQWRVLIAYYKQSCAAVTDESKREAMQRRLQKSSEGLSTGDLMYECRWMVMTVMALFFSFFLMDMAGDKAGDDWSKIVWAPVTMLLWPVMMRSAICVASAAHSLSPSLSLFAVLRRRCVGWDYCCEVTNESAAVRGGHTHDDEQFDRQLQMTVSSPINVSSTSAIASGEPLIV